ncbi:MAG: AlpA family phage regulatory protein [Oxalobacter sp.]|nr:AlpA family phage regulatory protein [Oxalobacter sp.]
MDFTNLSKQSIYRLMAENDFPRQINLGARKVAWLESEVRAWLDHRIEASKAS